MALQEISLSTGTVQASACSSGVSKPDASAGGSAFLLLMQTASQQTTTPGNSSVQGQGAAGEETTGQLPQNADTTDTKAAVLPYGASALAALFAIQAVGQKSSDVQAAAGTVQTGAATTSPTAQMQAAPIQSVQSSKTAESLTLLQPTAAQQSSAEPPAPVQKTQTLPQTASQISGSASGFSAQAAVSTQTNEQPVPAYTAVLPDVSPRQAQQVAQAAGQTQQQQLGTSAAAQTQTSPPDLQPNMSEKAVVLSSGGTADTAQAADGTDASAVQTQNGSQRIQTAEQGLAGSTGGTDRGDRISTADSAGMPAPSVAALYADGKVVIKVFDKAAQTQASPSRQIANAVAEGFKSGTKQLQVDLYPDSLGRVSVKLTSKDGLLTVQLAADNAKTQALLASNSGDIRSMLQNATGQSVQVVRQDQAAAQQWYAQDGGSGGQNRQQQQDGSRHKKDEESYSPDSVGAISTDDFLTIMRKTVGA